MTSANSEHTYTVATGRLASVAPLPSTEELRSDPPPKLRIWATYPNGSGPESIEITYDAEGPVTVDLIAGIVRSLEWPNSTATVHTVRLGTPELDAAINRLRDSKGSNQHG